MGDYCQSFGQKEEQLSAARATTDERRAWILASV